MASVNLDLPDDVYNGSDPESFVRELRLAAAVKWYELEQVSQSKAAQIAGVSRAEFLAALGRYGVTPFQYTSDEIVAEVDGG
jgi:predicted HTH domain antitoxin